MYASTCYFAPVQETMGDEVDFGWARMVFLKGPGIGWHDGHDSDDLECGAYVIMTCLAIVTLKDFVC